MIVDPNKIYTKDAAAAESLSLSFRQLVAGQISHYNAWNDAASAQEALREDYKFRFYDV